MENSSKQEPIILAHWIYTREEWKAFHHLELLKKSFFRYLCRRIIPIRYSHVLEIKITTASVLTNTQLESFHAEGRTFQRVNIRDAGKLNVMEIYYENGDGFREISIPIPKGKLKEAIQLQEELLYRYPCPAQTTAPRGIPR